VENQRRILVAGALPLTDAEADAFWPLFDAYEKERRPLDERANKQVADFLAQSATLTDAQAKAMVDEALAIEEGRLRVRRTYLGRMAKAIPPRKLARFFQIDNKLDAVVRADISKQIPLARGRRGGGKPPPGWRAVPSAHVSPSRRAGSPKRRMPRRSSPSNFASASYCL
jgi:hypothetical protein